MDVKKRVIYETDCEFAVYGDTYTRFFADGDFHTVPNNVEGAAKENGPRVVAERFPDGPAALHVQRLVPWDTEKSELADMFEARMEQSKKELGAKDALHFSGWSIGRGSDEYDHLLTDAERQLLDQ